MTWGIEHRGTSWVGGVKYVDGVPQDVRLRVLTQAQARHISHDRRPSHARAIALGFALGLLLAAAVGLAREVGWSW